MGDGNRRFGEYLRALRHSKHLTLDDVCQLTRGEPDGLSRAGLSDLENGKATLSMGRLVLLARVYGVRPSVLLERFESDYALERIDQAKLDRLPTGRLLDEARRTGMAGHIHRALLLYEQAEMRALEGAPDADASIRTRARIGMARAFYAAGRYHMAREMLEDLLADDPTGDARCWALFMLCQVAVDLGNTVLARGAHATLLEVPRPWPREIEGTESYLKARLIDLDESEDALLEAWLEARDAAHEHEIPTVEGHAMIRVSQIERARGNLRSAQRWAQRCFDFAEAGGLTWHRAAALIEFAQILEAEGRRRDAREAWLKAKSLVRRFRLHDLMFKIHAERWRHAVRDRDEKTAHRELMAAGKAARLLDGIPGDYRDVARALAETRQTGRGARSRRREEPR
ncbi:MAG: hypothetical protein Kow0062_23820 [Acidobacteriota bacterium]